MGKAEYTIELRKIEECSGKGVFDFCYDFYDDMFKCEFEKKFIDYYYFDEIGFETVDRFKYNLRAKLNLRMPYYRQLYETELRAQDLDFLLNKDYRETFVRTVDTNDLLKGTNNVNFTGNNNGRLTQTVNTDNTTGNKESHVADGVASASLNTDFLTDVGETKQTGTQTTSNVSEGSTRNDTVGTNTEDKTGKLLEKTDLVAKGNIGITSSAELLEKWRSVLLNLDEMIILECRDLFMGIF